jgi:lipopolysaccharide transport system permease protein
MIDRPRTKLPLFNFWSFEYMILKLITLYNSREIVRAWTNRIVRGRYQQSALGWLWAIIQPVASVLVFSVIFTRFVPVDTGKIPYIIFSYVAMVPWTFLSSSLSDMTSSLTQNMDLVSKIYFPRETLPVSAMLARFMDFGIASMLFLILMAYYHVDIEPVTLLYLPLILLIQVILIAGIGLLLSSMNVFFRDVQSMLALLIQIWFYASPIIYPVTVVPEHLRFLYYLNPMAGILSGYRAILLYQSPPPGLPLLIAGLEAFILLVLGYLFFKRMELVFADIV